MSFSHSLHRLQHAADYRQKGMCEERCTINRSDLRELLNDWARLDAEARDRYARVMSHAGQALLDSVSPPVPIPVVVVPTDVTS